MADRYEGKPLLRLLEMYVMWCIDELSDEGLAAMEEMTPHLQRVYQQTGTWQAILESVMDLPPNTPDEIRAVWKTAQDGGAAANVPIPAATFAQMFVDRNLT